MTTGSRFAGDCRSRKQEGRTIFFVTLKLRATVLEHLRASSDKTARCEDSLLILNVS